jgi:hypothetical protein
LAQVIEFILGLYRCTNGFKFLFEHLQEAIPFAVVENQFVVCKLFQVRTCPDSGIFGHKQESQRDHLGFIQEFFSCLIDDAGTVGPVLEKPFITLHPDAESTVKKPGGLRVLAFKASGFLNHRAMRWTVLSGQGTNDYWNQCAQSSNGGVKALD